MKMGVGEGQLAVPPGGRAWPPWMDVYSSPLDVGTTRKVLVVRTDHLGDLIVSTPFFETLRRSLPRSRVTALVTPYTAPVLERNPSVDEILAVDRSTPSDERSALYRRLRQEQFDAVIALSPTTRAYAIARHVRAPIRAGYIYSRRWVPRALSGVLLTHRAVFHIDRLVQRGEPVPHEVEQTLWFAQGLGFRPDPVPLRLYPDPEDVARARARLLCGSDPAPRPGAPEGFDWDAASRRECPWLAVQFAPHWLRPPWSMTAFIDLLRQLQKAIPGVGLVVMLGPGDGGYEHDLRSSGLMGDRMKVLGKLGFGEWAGVIGASRMALSPDTGSVHVAAAMRTPVVVAYEESSWAVCSQQWAPWLVPHRKVTRTAPAQAIPRIVEAAVDLWKPGR